MMPALTSRLLFHGSGWYPSSVSQHPEKRQYWYGCQAASRTGTNAYRGHNVLNTFVEFQHAIKNTDCIVSKGLLSCAVKL